MKTAKYLKNIGALIQETRQARNMTQNELAEELGTSQSAINRIENGKQNISLEMIARIGEVLSSEIVRINSSGKTNFRINGSREGEDHAAHHGDAHVVTSGGSRAAGDSQRQTADDER